MFSIPFDIYKIPDWNQWKIKIDECIFQETFESYKSAPYTDFYHIVNSNKPPSYFNQVVEAINPILKRIEATYPVPMCITQMWMQTAHMNQWHPPHNHGACGLSAILFYNFNQEFHTATTFFAPFNNFITGDQLEYTPPVSEGDLIVFPSMLLHMQPPNTSTVPRSIISFNIASVKN